MTRRTVDRIEVGLRGEGIVERGSMTRSTVDCGLRTVGRL